jgi:hypothetical protein
MRLTIPSILLAFLSTYVADAAQIRGASSSTTTQNRIPEEVGSHRKRSRNLKKDILKESQVDDGKGNEDDEDDDEADGVDFFETQYPKGLQSFTDTKPAEKESTEVKYPKYEDDDEDDDDKKKVEKGEDDGDGDDDGIKDKEDDQESSSDDAGDVLVPITRDEDSQLFPYLHKAKASRPNNKTGKKEGPFAKKSSSKKGGKLEKKSKLEDPKDDRKMSKYETLPKGVKLRHRQLLK